MSEHVTAVYLNCSLKKDNADSHTQRLMDRSIKIMESEEVTVETIHVLDHSIAFGMTQDASNDKQKDDWPMIQEKIMAADILVIGSPIWLGVKSSVATLVIERLYAYSGEYNDAGQYAYYGKVGGCVITGNEDGVKSCARDILFSLQHIGYTIPPQADCGWTGEAGPGASYGDEESGTLAGYDNDFTNRTVTFMTWNLIHMAKMLKANNGIPAQGNTMDGWKKVMNATTESAEPL